MKLTMLDTHVEMSTKLMMLDDAWECTTLIKMAENKCVEMKIDACWAVEVFKEKNKSHVGLGGFFWKKSKRLGPFFDFLLQKDPWVSKFFLKKKAQVSETVHFTCWATTAIMDRWIDHDPTSHELLLHLVYVTVNGQIQLAYDTGLQFFLKKVKN